MHPILINFGNVTIYSFGALLALGLISGGITVALLLQRAHLSSHGLFDAILFLLLCGVIGARLAYIVIYPQFFSPPGGSWTNAFALWNGGLIFYGAILGGLFATWFSFRRDSTLWRMFDLMTFGLFVGLIFGQIGCLFGGCANGILSSNRFALNGRVPIQLFEAGALAIVLTFGLLHYLRFSSWRKGGLIFIYGGLALFTIRLLTDYWRPSEVTWHNISALKIADAGFIVLFSVILVMRSKRRTEDR